MKLDTRLLLCLSFCFCGALRAQVSDACIACHSDSEFFAEDRLQIVSDFREDVHAGVGLSCHDCHGGNHVLHWRKISPLRMDRDYANNPYPGSPQTTEIPAFCGRCHSDPGIRKRFQPDIRVDQEREYWTSGHGMALSRGDNKVRDLYRLPWRTWHQVRWQRPLTRLSNRCCTHLRRLPWDADYMKDYELPSGQKLPVNRWRFRQASVHGRAMMQRRTCRRLPATTVTEIMERPPLAWSRSRLFAANVMVVRQNSSEVDQSGKDLETTMRCWKRVTVEVVKAAMRLPSLTLGRMLRNHSPSYKLATGTMVL